MKTLTFLLLAISLNCYSQTANEYYQRGKSKVELGDYRGAIIDFSKEIEYEIAHAEINIINLDKTEEESEISIDGLR